MITLSARDLQDLKDFNHQNRLKKAAVQYHEKNMRSPRPDLGAITSSGLGICEKVQLAMDGLLGVREARSSGVKPFRGIQEAFFFITGETDCSRISRGSLYKVSEAIGTGDFPNILLNSMTKRLIQDYAQIGMGGVEKIIKPANIADFKTNDRVRMGYLGDLPVVAEAAVYTELTKPTDEKISYAVAKRGGVLTISEEAIRNDDLTGPLTFAARLARAGGRTLKQFVTSIFLNNANYDPDGVALFNAAHNNLTANALTSANLDAAEVLMMGQTEKDSTKPLNLPLQWLMVPTALKATAYQINNNASSTNSWFERLGSNHEQPQNIIVNELLTSGTRWWGGCYPDQAPGIEIGYLDGIEEPQIFIADKDFSNLRFTNDQIVYKGVFVFGGKPLDFRTYVQNN